MATTNSHATLTDFKNWLAVRGLAGTTGTDTSDDAVIENLLEAASRYVDGSRTFYPRIETRNYCLPEDDELILDDDLLSVISVTDGSSTTMSSSDYHLLPVNSEPKFAIRIKDSSTKYWQTDADGSDEYVIALNGWWGYHERFTQRAWLSGGTLSAAITDTTTLAFSATTGHSLVAGNICKIDSEIYNIATTATNTITPIKRGDNGSTAATHLISSVVYVWQPMEDIQGAVLSIVGNMYANRSGQPSGGRVSVTASGVVIRPEDVPPMAKMVIDHYRRIS